MRRYLPLEIARWAGELGFARLLNAVRWSLTGTGCGLANLLAAYWLTDSFAAAVVVGLGASVGYYATASVNADAAFLRHGDFLL